MGLKGPFTLEDGTVYPECYALYLNVTADKTSCFVTFAFYENKEKRDQNLGSMFAVKLFPFPVECIEGKVPDIFYDHVKLREALFRDWVDVIESAPVVVEETPSV